MKSILTLTTVILILQSCEQQARKNYNTTSQQEKKTTSKPEVKENIFKDIFVFDSYYDNGDYYILNAKNGAKEEYTFINDDNDDRSLIKGDKCEITWKKDTITIPGDGESTAVANWIISIKKLE